jgi:hypothetical protein
MTGEGFAVQKTNPARGSAGIEACIQIIATCSREDCGMNLSRVPTIKFLERTPTLFRSPFVRGDENMPAIFIMWAVPTIIVLGGISYYFLRAVQ